MLSLFLPLSLPLSLYLSLSLSLSRSVYVQEILKKCQRCMEVIIDAKERQAAEANKNATILLQEIDQEKVYMYVHVLVCGLALCSQVNKLQLVCMFPLLHLLSLSLSLSLSWIIVGSNHTRGSSFFLWKSNCLGCAVLLCFVVCMTLLASFFLPSSSL